jgi:hypothetical protein
MENSNDEYNGKPGTSMVENNGEHRVKGCPLERRKKNN